MRHQIYPGCRAGQILALFAIVVATIEGTSRAQNTDIPEELPSAEHLMERHIAAMGGQNELNSVTSQILIGKFSNDVGGHTFDAPVTVSWLAPNKQHMLFDRPMNMVLVTDGKRAWRWKAGPKDSQDAGTTEWLADLETKKLIEKAESRDEVQWRDRFRGVATKGIELVNGKPAYEVLVTTKSGETYSKSFDKESGRLVKTSRNVTDSLGQYKLDSVVDRYEKFGNVWIATKVTHTFHSDKSEMGTQAYEFSEVKLNSKLSGSLFEVPQELTAKYDESNN